jgi:hypothetical protein
MVEIMLEGLRADPRFEVDHVDARWFGVRVFMD